MAYNAWLAIAPIDLKMMLKIPCLTGDMQEIAQGRTAGNNSVFQHLPDGAYKRFGLIYSLMRRFARVDTSQE
jgi:hypothetical protein